MSFPLQSDRFCVISNVTKCNSTYLHDVRDIECRYGFLECKYRAMLHGSTTDCTAVSASGQTTVKRDRINGGKLILSLVYDCRIINNVLQLVV